MKFEKIDLKDGRTLFNPKDVINVPLKQLLDDPGISQVKQACHQKISELDIQLKLICIDLVFYKLESNVEHCSDPELWTGLNLYGNFGKSRLWFETKNTILFWLNCDKNITQFSRDNSLSLGDDITNGVLVEYLNNNYSVNFYKKLQKYLFEIYIQKLL